MHSANSAKPRRYCGALGVIQAFIADVRQALRSSVAAIRFKGLLLDDFNTKTKNAGWREGSGA